MRELARGLHEPRAMMGQLRLAIAFSLLACASQDPPTKPLAPVAMSLADAAAEAHVPPDLVTAIAIEEGGIRLPARRVVHAGDSVPVAGALELRHGRLDTLALGAKLLDTTEDALRADTDLATRAGAHVLAALGTEHGAGASLASWRPALEALSGMDDRSAHDYASRVFAILRTGGTYTARDAERISLAPHAELDAHDTVQTTANLRHGSDFPGAIWFTTSCTDKCTVGRPLGTAAVDKIVIHDTEGGWDGSVATLQYDTGKSVHYIIDADGSRVGQFRHESDTTWHAGNYFYNETSVGIEHVGVASDSDGYSPALYATSRDLVQNIRTRWQVPLDRTHIIGHYQIPDGTVVNEESEPCTDTLDNCETSAQFGGSANHRDPGYYWQWCQYMQALGGSCTCNDAWPLWNCTTDKTEAVRCHDGVVEIATCDQGCDVQPIGSDDICHASAGGDPDAGVPDADDGSGNPDQPGDHGGCSTAGGGSWLVLLAALGLTIRRRR